ncbi:TPA: ead/Ea22-like family protein [Klebsiella pneumoniae]|uniref:ead/Ea22-like family protein n=1 Tax=Klebsiella pneumoniae TaxID=573 RepID=UPI001D17D510|nr:ead/Ea22-like family protein [Klebsiella pneumoniae]
MNIETVNELIQSLESAGELSIKETKVMALAKAYQQLAAENVALKSAVTQQIELRSEIKKAGRPPHADFWIQSICEAEDKVNLALKETPATDRIVAGIKADGRVEGAHFVANRMLAAWDAGFIKDTAKNAADIARMILTSTEFMADAPEGDFDRSFADGILEDIAQQLREGAK